MGHNINTSCNLADFITTSTSSMDMINNTKTLTVGTGKPYNTGAVNAQLEFRPVGAKLPGGFKANVSTYDPATGAMTTRTGIIEGYSRDCPVQECALAMGTISTFTNPGLALVAGDAIRIARHSTVASWGTGTVTSYNATTGALVVNITAVGTTGTFSDLVIVSEGTFSNWNISYSENDTLTLLGRITLTIDSNFARPIGAISSELGTVTISNTSTTNMLKLEYSRYAINIGAITNAATMNILGDYINIGTGDGTTGQVIDISSYNIMVPTRIEVETGAGTNEYTPWYIVTDGLTGDGIGMNCYTPDYVWGNGETGNVLFFDAITKKLRCGNGTNGNVIPLGANVRMPNIYITSEPKITYATTSVTSSQTGYVLGVVDCSLFLTNNASNIYINGETINTGNRTGVNVNLSTRGVLDTQPAAISPGDVILSRRIALTTGSERALYLVVNPGGTLNVDTAQFQGFYFMLANGKSVSLKRFGTDLEVNANTTAGDIVIDDVIHGQVWTNTRPLYVYAVMGDVSISNFRSHVSFFGYGRASQNNAPVLIDKCQSLVKFENIQIVQNGANTTRTSGIYLNAISLKDETYAINNLAAIGGYIYIYNSFGLKFKDISFGIKMNPTPLIFAANTTASAATDEFDISTSTFYSPTTTVPPTGTLIRFMSGTYPTTVPAIGNGANYYLIRVSDTKFKIAARYRDALNGVALDLTTNGGTNISVLGDQTPPTYYINLYNVSDIVIDGITDIGCGGYFYMIYADNASRDIEIYNINYETNYYGTYLIQNSGKNVTVKNAWLGTVFPRAYTGNSGGVNGGMMPSSSYGSGTRLENVRYNADTTGLLYSNSYNGVGYTDDCAYNFIVGYLPFYHTTTGAASNMQDVGPFLNFVDVGQNPTTGTLGIAAMASSDYVVTAGGSYLDNDGRCWMTATGDSVTITSRYPVIGVTSFQNATPTFITTSGANYTYEFRIKTPLGSWSAWQTMDGANLSAALGALTDYNSNIGFYMSVKITATLNGSHYFMAGWTTTNVDSTWTSPDAYYTVVGASSTEIVEAYRYSDKELLTQRLGSGRIDIPSGEALYFRRRTADDTTIMSTYDAPVTPVLGYNGTIEMYHGKEIQVADASDLATTAATAVWNNSKALTVGKFLGLK